MMGLKKGQPNTDFPIGASMTNSWVPTSKRKGPEKVKEKLWIAGGGWILVHALYYAKHTKAQHPETLFPASTFSREMRKLKAFLV